jgi:hypothetical protein
MFAFGKSNLPIKANKDDTSSSTMASTEQVPLMSNMNNRNNSTSPTSAINKVPRFSPPGGGANSPTNKQSYTFRQDSMGYSPDDNHANRIKISSLTYLDDESEAYRAYNAANHFDYRGRYWNDGKREIIVRYFQLATIGLLQGSVAYFTNVLSHHFIRVSKDSRYVLLYSLTYVLSFEFRF